MRIYFKKFQICALVIGTIALISILLLLFFFTYPTLARKRVLDAVVFKNGTDAMERFQSTKDLKDLRITFYLYNVTNPFQVINSSAKIHLKEIGPFVYSELRVKEFVDNNQTSGLITYKLKRRFIFEPSLSVADPKKLMITWINVPLIVAQAYLDRLPFYQKIPAYYAINHAISTKKEPAFITDTVDNFLFSGSKREFFDYLQSLDVFKIVNPWPLIDNKFGILYGKNNTWNPLTDRYLTASAGFGLNQTYHNLNQYILVNGSSELPFWRQQPPQCNKVGGTDGEFFSPFIGEEDELEVYSSDICRKLKFKFVENIYIKGVLARKFALDEKSLQSGQKNPENQCYCRESTPPNECMLDGLIDLSGCDQPNVVASGAHFYSGSPELISQVDGLAPANVDTHQPVIYVEPNIGLNIKVRTPIQFNIRLSKGGFKLFDFYQNDTALVLPLLWLMESIELTDDQAALIKSQLLLLDSWLVTMVLGGAIIFIVAIIVIATIVCLRYRESRVGVVNSETEPLIDTASNSSYQAISDNQANNNQ